MPLLEGKKNIGHNIKVEEEHGKPKKQAIAIALNKAGESKDAEELGPHNTHAEMKVTLTKGPNAGKIYFFKRFTDDGKCMLSRDLKTVIAPKSLVVKVQDSAVVEPISIAEAKHNAGVTKSQDAMDKFSLGDHVKVSGTNIQGPVTHVTHSEDFIRYKVQGKYFNEGSLVKVKQAGVTKSQDATMKQVEAQITKRYEELVKEGVTPAIIRGILRREFGSENTDKVLRTNVKYLFSIGAMDASVVQPFRVDPIPMPAGERNQPSLAPVPVGDSTKQERAKTRTELNALKERLAKEGKKILKEWKVPAGGFEVEYEDATQAKDADHAPHKFEPMPGNKKPTLCNRCLERKAHANHDVQAKDFIPMASPQRGSSEPEKRWCSACQMTVKGKICQTCGNKTRAKDEPSEPQEADVPMPVPVDDAGDMVYKRCRLVDLGGGAVGVIAPGNKTATRFDTVAEAKAHVDRMGQSGDASKRDDDCPKCGGSGQVAARWTMKNGEQVAASWRPCPECGGLGAKDANEPPMQKTPVKSVCPTCKGGGTEALGMGKTRKCPDCGGSGRKGGKDAVLPIPVDDHTVTATLAKPPAKPKQYVSFSHSPSEIEKIYKPVAPAEKGRLGLNDAVRPIDTEAWVKCPTCAGVGERSSGNTCVTCKGSGKVVIKPAGKAKDVMVSRYEWKCPHCAQVFVSQEETSLENRAWDHLERKHPNASMNVKVKAVPANDRAYDAEKFGGNANIKAAEAGWGWVHNNERNDFVKAMNLQTNLQGGELRTWLAKQGYTVGDYIKKLGNKQYKAKDRANDDYYKCAVCGKTGPEHGHYDAHDPRTHKFKAGELVRESVKVKDRSCAASAKDFEPDHVAAAKAAIAKGLTMGQFLRALPGSAKMPREELQRYSKAYEALRSGKADDRTRAADSIVDPAIHLHNAMEYEVAGDRARALDSYRAAAAGFRQRGNGVDMRRAADGVAECQRRMTGETAAFYDHPGRGRAQACDSADAALRVALERTRAGENVRVEGQRVVPRTGGRVKERRYA